MLNVLIESRYVYIEPALSPPGAKMKFSIILPFAFTLSVGAIPLQKRTGVTDGKLLQLEHW